MKNLIFTLILLVITYSSFANNSTRESLIPLTQNEINDLKFLREEEKLARDVYLYSYDKYQMNIFNNISKSEQVHMNSVLNLMTKYGIPDSASKERGVFNNTELQSLYTALITQSDISLVEALKVGATIEDLDINDIDNFIKNTKKYDLLNVYGKLTCGSKNHIRAYTRQLNSNEVTYSPKYISIDYYNTILNESDGGCGR